MNTSKQTRTIRLNLSIEEYQQLIDQIEQQHCTQKSYIKNKLLSDELGAKLLSDRIMQMMPAFYNLIAEVNDPSVRKRLEEFGGTICQFLK